MHGSSDVAPAPRGRDRFVTFSRPTVLYQGDGIIVTTAFVESGGHRFLVRELSDIERVEHGGLLQSRLYELWAWFRDQRVRLFRCYDAQEFGQVCRALTRAREYAGLA
jgi:hypothetical protein